MHNYTLKVTKGRTARWRSQITVDGNPEDLVNENIILVAKYSLTDPDAQELFHCTRTPADGIDVTDEAAGKFTLTISDEKTANLPSTQEPIVAKYEIIYSQATGEKWSLASGDLIIYPRAVV